jgi:hypothetical protein
MLLKTHPRIISRQLTETVTFAKLRDEISYMDIIKGNLEDRVDDVLDKARVNADDTVYVDKSAPASEWDSIALGSISDVLAYHKDPEVIKWFSDRGVTF